MVWFCIILYFCKVLIRNTLVNKNIYKIPFKGLENGVHEFEFVLEKDFFETFEELKDTEGKLIAKVVLNKSEILISLKINIEGSVQAICDRCLDDFDLPIEAQTDLFVKFGSETEELAENLIVVSDKEDNIDMKDLFYELYMLSFPLKVMHPEIDGKSTCNEKMLDKLDEYSVDSEDNIDPRWDELRKMINN